ncbi:hypothetical protein OS493_029195 [Desmophyllum pertusum]|uniref:Mutator-like transposase domain-containing protein n=1 Tax=Desmophyllum pertusum TaxID=174260 RepID=A0A9X0D8R2_9CNID|nr:hypothetical protein OS493_029195 [Desmophyllum pertusum]
MDLANVCEEVRPDGLIPLLKVKYSHCNSISTLRPAESHRKGKQGRAALDINSRAGLATLHAGIGHTHFSGLLSTLGLPSLTSRTFKKREREAGAGIENVAKRSCTEYTESEKTTVGKEQRRRASRGGGRVLQHNMGWRKRGKSYDSSSRVGTAVGLKTGNILNYATRSICKEAINRNKKPVAHDCRKNHQGSSKSMEANVAVQLFTDAVEQSVCYSTYVGDDDKFNKYLLPDKKFIAENATKIHGVSMKYQNGARQLEKNGELLPAVSQTQGLSEIQVDSQIVLVAHNGNRFDFPILLHSLREQELLQQFLDCNILLLDSLTVITEEMKIHSSLLKECKGKSLGTIYKNLFEETFDVHDSLEDVIALKNPQQ